MTECQRASEKGCLIAYQVMHSSHQSFDRNLLTVPKVQCFRAFEQSHILDVATSGHRILYGYLQSCLGQWKHRQGT